MAVTTRVLLLGNMLSKISYLLQQTYWKVRLLFKNDRKVYLSLYHHLGIMANNIKFYQIALSHKSMSMIDKEGHRLNNERLEYLGDSVISMAVADYLFSHYKEASEGMLTTTRSKLVNRKYLNNIAFEQHIDCFIRKGKSVVSPNNNVYGNTMEAIMGAIYLDRGYRTSCEFVEKWIIKNPEHMDVIIYTETNPKARLMEWGQKNKMQLFFYFLPETRDKEHHPHFEVDVFINGIVSGHGSGRTKKEAEQNASEEALRNIKA